MSYSVYVNEHNSKATVHEDDCKQVRKHGGHGKGYWVDCLDTYEEAWEWIEDHIDQDEYYCKDCSKCL